MGIPTANSYIKNFEGLGLGMFVHFGLYSLLEQGEWVKEFHHIPDAAYEKLTEHFRPKSMENLVLAAKGMGAKYITLTTRHHDGFSLYDAKGLNSYDAPHSAAGRDLVREFVDACHTHDIMPFFYHTTLDWHNPDFEGDFPRYLQYLRDSIEVLCTNYGKVGGFWFDGNWSKTGEGDVWEEKELYALIRKYQPDAMIINNTGLSKAGETGNLEIDSVTFERGVAAPMNREGMPKYLTGEVCDSLGSHWGIADDLHMKSPAQLIESICSSRKVGANYLLNIGPKANGTLNAYTAATLQMIGRWMHIYGEAVYRGRPCWYAPSTKNFILKSADEKLLFFFVHDLSVCGCNDVTVGEDENSFMFDNFHESFHDLQWMDNHEDLKYEMKDNGLSVHFTGFPYGEDYCVRVAKAVID